MIRLTDALVLAGTKLRAHRVRTGIITGVSGILFGALIAVVIIAQGVFDSADRYSSVGLGDRYVVAASSYTESFNIYDYLGDPEVVQAVDDVHGQIVTKKKAAAKKHNIEYNDKLEDPSPLVVEPGSDSKSISLNMMDSEAVQTINIQRSMETSESGKSLIDEKLKPFPEVKRLGLQQIVSPIKGSIARMKDGSEQAIVGEEKKSNNFMYGSGSDEESLYILPQTLADPFVTVNDYDPSAGELPVILPYGAAEKFLGLKKLPAEASAKDRRSRTQEVYSRAGEIKFEYCYRNEASNNLLGQAQSIAEEIEKNKNNKDFQKPSMIYAVPDKSSCGAVAVTGDTRTAAEKAYDARYKAYQQETGTDLGDPEQQKIVFRAVGVSADTATNLASNISGLAHSMLQSSLGYNSWNIPANLLEQVPEQFRPAAVFANQSDSPMLFSMSNELVEFDNVEDARKLVSSIDYSGKFYAAPFGSSSIVVSEIKHWFERILFWAVIVVGVIAMIILGGLVGRTIADSRRETAVFRSIGATRLDMSSVYTLYTLLFSIRVAIFACVLGLVVALIANFMWSENATVGADLAYGATDDSLRFGFIGLANPYLPAIVGTIILIGLISVIIPILRNVRRNPINDMRDE